MASELVTPNNKIKYELMIDARGWTKQAGVAATL
jgi:hypothetical protein